MCARGKLEVVIYSITNLLFPWKKKNEHWDAVSLVYYTISKDKILSSVLLYEDKILSCVLFYSMVNKSAIKLIDN